jgi:hypothetical protein
MKPEGNRLLLGSEPIFIHEDLIFFVVSSRNLSWYTTFKYPYLVNESFAARGYSFVSYYEIHKFLKH